MIAKEIVSELSRKMEEGQELEVFPKDWGLFGKAAKIFNDAILEEAIRSFPTHNVETPGKLFFFLCKKATKMVLSKNAVDLSKLTNKF